MNEEKFDNLIKQKFQSLRLQTNLIEPSADFTKITMAKIYRIEQSRKKIIRIAKVGLFLSPFILKEIWLFLRNDYFSVAKFPFSELIASTYRIFLSPAASYSLLALGFALAIIYLYKTRELSATLVKY